MLWGGPGCWPRPSRLEDTRRATLVGPECLEGAIVQRLARFDVTRHLRHYDASDARQGLAVATPLLAARSDQKTPVFP